MHFAFITPGLVARGLCAFRREHSCRHPRVYTVGARSRTRIAFGCNMKLCVVGGGKMAEALLGGLLATGWAAASDLIVVEISAARRGELQARFPEVALADSLNAVPSACADVLIAVKPQHVEDVVRALGPTERILSIAAGVRIDALRRWSAGDARILRVMPNTPALVGRGAAALAAAPNATPDDLTWAQGILQAVGTVELVDEAAMDAVTALSGSGPAYAFLLAEAMAAAGTNLGLTPDVADRLARQTLLGAASLLAESGDDPAKLRANVTSPGGTTAAAIKVMQDNNLEQIIANAMAAAAKRSKELGDQ